MNLFAKQKQIHRLREQTYEYQGGKGKDKLGIWDGHVHTAILKITNKDLLYGTGNYAQYSVIT